jgi:hypothetical protein
MDNLGEMVFCDIRKQYWSTILLTELHSVKGFSVKKYRNI